VLFENNGLKKDEGSAHIARMGESRNAYKILVRKVKYRHTAKFASHTGGPVWEPLAQRRRTARMCALYKSYNGERAWKDIGDRLQAPYYRSRVDRCWKIRSRKKEQMLGNSPL
jgi:hypothetical protein